MSASWFVVVVVACNVGTMILAYQALKHFPVLVHLLCSAVAAILRACGRHVHVGEKRPCEGCDGSGPHSLPPTAIRARLLRMNHYIVKTADDSDVTGFYCDSPAEAARLWTIEFSKSAPPEEWVVEPIEVWVTGGSGQRWRFNVKARVEAEVVRL